MNVGLACSDMNLQVCVCLQSLEQTTPFGLKIPYNIDQRILETIFVRRVCVRLIETTRSHSSLLSFHVSTFTSSHKSQGLAHVYHWCLIPTMASNSVRFATKAAVLLGLALGINAVPSVNVALKTSFGAPPYLVELLYV